MKKLSAVIAFSALALISATSANAALAPRTQHSATCVHVAPATAKSASSISTMPNTVAEFNALVHTLQLDDSDFSDDDDDLPVVDYTAQMC